MAFPKKSLNNMCKQFFCVFQKVNRENVPTYIEIRAPTMFLLYVVCVEKTKKTERGR